MSKSVQEIDRENKRLKNLEEAKKKICPLSIADSNEIKCKTDKCMLWKKVYFHEEGCLIQFALRMISENFQE
jgi:hypothetical protein